MKSLEPHMHDDDSQFDMLVSAMQRRLATITVLGQPLFTCDAPDLYQRYLDGFAYPDDRQHHTCNCCRQFIERFGNLVVIDPDTGAHKSAIWPDHEVAILSLFYVSMRYMTASIAKANVNGVFIAKETLWGTPKAGGFSHFAVTVPAAYVKGNRYLEPHQVMAQKKQDFGTLSHGLADFKIDTVNTAVSLLESDTLFRSEKFIGPAKFLRELHLRLASTKNSARRKNMIWHAVATAPVGFATPRSSMIGTLLEDIAAGMDFQSVKKRFAAKADPMQYQRPQAAPTSGNIAQAEKIVEKLGIANSLRRRPARLDEIRGMLWTPATPGLRAEKQGGIFGHLLPEKGRAPLLASFGSITFEKFKKQVLGNALKIEVFMRDTMDFVGFVTATDPDAPPILQWDIDGKRNPVSWYVYHNGSRPHQWSLRPAQWVEVTRIATKPSAWDDPEKFAHFGDSVAFLLKGAVDTRKSGLSLFPETLKPELHSIRSTIESFSKNGTLDEGEATANGVLLGKNNGPLTVRVTSELGVVEYLIDRLD